MHIPFPSQTGHGAAFFASTPLPRQDSQTSLLGGDCGIGFMGFASPGLLATGGLYKFSLGRGGLLGIYARFYADAGWPDVVNRPELFGPEQSKPYRNRH
jgi:hypothetical protein